MATSNVTTNFVPLEGEWELRYFPIKVSVVYAEGTAMAPEISSNDVTGYLTYMGTTNTTGADFMGILAEPVAAADADYATAGKLKAVWVPKSPNSRAKFTVGTGTFTTVDVFKTAATYGSGISVNVDSKGLGVRIVKYIDSTHGECTFSMPNTVTA